MIVRKIMVLSSAFGILFPASCRTFQFWALFHSTVPTSLILLFIPVIQIFPYIPKRFMVHFNQRVIGRIQNKHPQTTILMERKNEITKEKLQEICTESSYKFSVSRLSYRQLFNYPTKEKLQSPSANLHNILKSIFKILNITFQLRNQRSSQISISLFSKSCTSLSHQTFSIKYSDLAKPVHISW